MNELLAKYFSGNATTEECERVQAWRNESTENAAEFFEYASVWHDAAPDRTTGKQQQFLEQLLGERKSTEQEGAKLRVMWSRPLKYVAAAVLLLVAVYYLLPQKDGLNIDTLTGQTKDVTLPDGSIVTLSAQSRLSYPKEFSPSVREVFLEGKAFFDVAKKADHPFVVKTTHASVRVLGTSFLVDAKTPDVEVVVATGKVAMADKYGKQPVELLPGDAGKIEVKAGLIKKMKNTDSNYLAWKTKHLEFDKTPLMQVFEELEETYFVSVKLPQNLYNDCFLTATYHQQPIEAIMEIIGQTFNLNIQQNGKEGFQVSGEGCQ